MTFNSAAVAICVNPSNMAAANARDMCMVALPI
jgi:hypothetical protein